MNNSGKIVNLGNPTSPQDAATRYYVDTSIPIGGIIMWSGAGVALPSNWKLCDGSTYGSVITPDLRGRFVLSSGSGSGLSARTVGQSGGVETVALTETQMPKHKHGVKAETGDANKNATDGAHGHPVSLFENPGSAWSDPTSVYVPNTGVAANHIAWQYGYIGKAVYRANNNNTAYHATDNPTGTLHNHVIRVTEDEKGGTSALTASPHENMPPFYVLAFIMRIS